MNTKEGKFIMGLLELQYQCQEEGEEEEEENFGQYYDMIIMLF